MTTFQLCMLQRMLRRILRNSTLRHCTLVALGCLLVTSFFSPSVEAQIVRRYVGGGVQVNAPFVRVNVGPGGTSVRAPFTSVDTAGRVYLGRRRRLLPPGVQRPAPITRQVAPSPTVQPTPAHVDDLPYPTPAQLATMDDAQLVETLRQMMARFHYRLSLLRTGEGWQKYLVLSREILGSPGSGPDAVRVDAIQAILPRYQSVLENSQFSKISSLPSFGATFAALQVASRRLTFAPVQQQAAGPQIFQPGVVEPASLNVESTPAAATPVTAAPPVETVTEKAAEILPSPEPAEVPNAERGERSILKRK